MNKKSRFPRMIVFFGPDGVGKSTQVQLLMRHLRSQKCPAVYIWIRGRHTIALVLANFLMKLGYYRIVKVPSGVVYRIFDPLLIPGLKNLWGVIEFISVLPLIIIRGYMPRFFGRVIVAERYVVDTVVFLGYWFGHDFLQSRLARILLRFIPQGSVLIHLDADTQTLIKRLRYDTATMDFLVFQTKAYRMLAKTLGAATIDTSEYNINETFHKIIEVLLRNTSKC